MFSNKKNEEEIKKGGGKNKKHWPKYLPLLKNTSTSKGTLVYRLNWHTGLI